LDLLNRIASFGAVATVGTGLKHTQLRHIITLSLTTMRILLAAHLDPTQDPTEGIIIERREVLHRDMDSKTSIGIDCLRASLFKLFGLVVSSLRRQQPINGSGQAVHLFQLPKLVSYGLRGFLRLAHASPIAGPVVGFKRITALSLQAHKLR
jgi:hypothetical protein